MIVVRLIGGLGNQCFQYALGRHLAAIHHTILKIDLSAYEAYKLHAYSLASLNITAGIASTDDIRGLTPVKEAHLHFDPAILRLPDNVYLSGYWPTEKYFAPIRDTLLTELSVKTSVEGRDRAVAWQIQATQSVSLHVRRADYVPNTYVEQIFESCDLDYYDRAIAELTRTVTSPELFVFSDDHNWVREHLKLPYPTTYVDHNRADRNYQDLRLMSLCKHNIIANSTYSWWGGWLNRNPTKIVIAPKKWFTDRARSSSEDVIPPSWVQL